ncbi:MAG: DNA repair and recombination protein RadA [Promethearchaeota archaeon]
MKVEFNQSVKHSEGWGRNLSLIPGIGPQIIKRLTEAGYSTLMAIATVPPRILQADSGLGEKTSLLISKAAQELCEIKFTTASEIFARRKAIGRVSTRSPSLDDLLGGGFECGSVTELVGEYRTGKTQLVHQACINVQLPEDRGGLSGNALFIDTEGTFRPERLVQMALAQNIDIRKALERIIYARAYNCEHQVSIVKDARKIIEEKNIKVVVVDSIINHFRAEFSGTGSIAGRQQLLNVHLHQIIHLAETYSIAAIVTNQVQVKPDVFFGNPLRATGGNILAHGCMYRIFLRKARGNNRVAVMVDAPGLPEGEVTFKITPEGISER